MKARKEMVWMSAKVGAVIGALVFLVFGITSTFYLWGYGTITLMSFITGGPLQATPLVIIVSAVSVLFGITLLVVLFGAAGALISAIVGYGIEKVAPVSVADTIQKAEEMEQVEPHQLDIPDKITADILVDTSGQTCPLPIINLEKAIRNLPLGNIVEVHSTCPAFLGEVKSWCNLTRNKLLAFYIQSNLSVALIEKAYLSQGTTPQSSLKSR